MEVPSQVRVCALPSSNDQEAFLCHSWIEGSFEGRRAELHGWGALDDGRIAVWGTLYGRHVGRGMPWLGDRAPSGAQIAWQQLHVFAVEGDHLTEHWAVRDDLRVIEAVDAANG
jgi:hypothetical protein